MSNNNQFAIVRKEMDAVLADAGALEFRPVIMAQAAIMKVDESLLEIPENVGELIKSMQYTRKFGLVPSIDMHVMPFNTNVARTDEKGREVKVWEKRISVVVGEQAYKKSAKVQARNDRDFIDFETEEMTRESLRAYVSEHMPKVDLTPQDRGIRARVLSANTARMYKDMGRLYDPEWSYGFCFLQGIPRVYNGKKTYPKGDADRIPNQRTPLDVARRRAVKSAIMVKYPLVAIDDRTPEQRMAQVLDLAIEESPAPHANALPVNTSPAVDNDCLFMVEDSALPDSLHDVAAIDPDGGMVPDDSRGRADEADADWASIPDKDASQASTQQSTGYAHLRDKLTGNAKQFVEWCAKLDADPKAGACTEAQYRFLLSLFKNLAGKGREEAALEVVFGRVVCAANRPGFKITKQLLDIIPSTSGKGDEKTDNEKHRADIAGIIEVIGQMVKE